MQRVVFRDLDGPQRELSDEERRWITTLAPQLNAPPAVSVGASGAREEPELVLVPQLDGTWKAGRYIGELRRDDRVLEIVPRLGIETIAAWVGAIFNVRIITGSASQSGTSALIAQLVAATWRSALIDAARNGLPGLREPRHHVGSFARGRLDVAASARLRVARQPLVASIDRPRSLDNPVSRSIVAADRVLDRRLPGNWRGPRATEILTHLRGATGQRATPPTRQELRRVRYTPITRPFERVADLSWQIAHRRGLHAAATAEHDDGLLLDVAELWELFLVHCCKRAFGAANVTHGTTLGATRSLLTSTTDPAQTMGRLYPDIIVGPIQHPRLIIDAKYKRLTNYPGVQREDLYQLNAYLHAYSDAKPPGFLAYPNFDDAPPPRPQALGPWTTASGRQAHFTRLPTTEQACIAALTDLANSVNA